MTGAWKYGKRIQGIKEQMSHLLTDAERWDYMCDTCKHWECEYVKEWAESRWPGFGPDGTDQAPQQQHRFAPHELDTDRKEHDEQTPAIHA